MSSTLHLKTQILEGNKIKIDDPNFKVGEIVEVFIVLPQEKKPNNILETIETIRKNRSSFRTKDEINQELAQERNSWD